MHPIAQAVEPRRADTVARALEVAQRRIARIQEHVAAHAGDINCAYPMPSARTMGRIQYREALDARHFAQSLVDMPATYRPGAQVIVAFNTVKMQRYYDNVASMANAQFDAYVGKLIAKAGEGVASASIDDAPLWNGSRLTVDMVNGERQVWHTRQILNVSSLGKLFMQWPTRRKS